MQTHPSDNQGLDHRTHYACGLPSVIYPVLNRQHANPPEFINTAMGPGG